MKMEHPIYRIIDFENIGSFALRVKFDDGQVREIDFRPILAGELYGPLQDEKLFNQVEIDPEIHTLVWPNGADFDPLYFNHTQGGKLQIKQSGDYWLCF